MNHFTKKSLFAFLGIFLITFFSCSEDNSEELNESDNNEINYKFPKTITYPDFWSGGTIRQDFAYFNGLLIKERDGGEMNYFEHNNDGKIVLRKECADQGIADENIDTYECQGFYDSTLYNYENGQLVSYSDSSGNVGCTILEYDSSGNLISDFCDSQYSENIYYTYDNNGNILTMTLSYQGSSSVITFEYDGKKNPYYGLYRTFGFEGSISSGPYGLVSSLFKQNATKVYRNNELKKEANYTYDVDGYPISCGFTEYLNDGTTRQGTIQFTYN